jgi:hypothetical protein
VVVDRARGDARSGVLMTTDTLMNWLSMTKPVTAIAVAQQWEAGALGVDARLFDARPQYPAGTGPAPTCTRPSAPAPAPSEHQLDAVGGVTHAGRGRGPVRGL